MLKIKAHIGRARAFRRDDSGAAAIEFALIAPVLFFALLSLFEIGVLGIMTSGLDNAVIEASRKIRTGRSDAATSAATMEQQICAQMGILNSCGERLVTSVQRFGNFVGASTQATSQPDNQFDKGGASDIILVKANYKWPLMSPFVTRGFGRTAPLEVTITSRLAFKNEPFE